MLLLGAIGPARSGGLAQLTPLARECFATQSLRACERALIEAEALQQQAADRDRYACQSMVLGLQADVVMVQLQAGRGGKAYDTLAAVQQRCSGF